jgi:hypothetical protein
VLRRAPVLALIAAFAGAALLVSGGSSADPRTPPGLPGEPAPFLGTAVAGSGALTAAIDAYGDVVDLRLPGPAGNGLIENSAARQAAGSVPASTGIVIRAGAGGRPRPLWKARWVRQGYLPGTNVVVTRATVAGARVRIVDAAGLDGATLLRSIVVRPVGGEGRLLLSAHLRGGDSATFAWRASNVLHAGVSCSLSGCSARPPSQIGREIGAVAAADRRWVARALPLGPAAPGWARAMYRRSLLVLRALTDRRSGAAAAGARDGWAFVWPRDAATAALALWRAGYRGLARRAARFLLSVDLGAGARFHGDRSAVGDGRGAQGDAAGWLRLAARATGLPPPAATVSWRGSGDYGERDGESGDLIANAIAAGEPAAALRREFGAAGSLARRAGDPGSGADAAAAWAIRPFPRPSLYRAAETSLRPLLAGDRGLGILPAQDWNGSDPWTAPTAWTAWALAALGERRGALRLLGDLRRAATPAGTLPERVGARSGIPRSTTPLGWAHAFAILALQELWPRR